MIKPGERLSWTILLPIAIVLVTSACASKKYVSKQVNQVNQNFAQYQKQTNDHIAYLNREQSTTSAQLNQRIDSADHKLSAMATTVQETQGTASRAMEEATKPPAPVEPTIVKPTNYQLLDKADVLFGFNKANLTRQATSSLDEIVSKFQATPGAVIELAGFTDPIGSASYNLELSRRRAWAVQRYLVDHNVPLRSIHVVGMGKENPPESLSGPEAANASKSDRNQMARRVNIRIYEAGGNAPATDDQ
jgi:OmpA-OmpF porin, OOP family